MRYNLSNPIEAGKAKAYLASLIKQGAKSVEIASKKKRTLSQNALLHLWIRCFADFIGETDIEYCKTAIVRAVIGQNERENIFTGKSEVFDFRTRDFTTEQMSDFLDKFHAWAQVNYDVRLPYPGDVGYEEMFNAYIE